MKQPDGTRHLTVGDVPLHRLPESGERLGLDGPLSHHASARFPGYKVQSIWPKREHCAPRLLDKDAAGVTTRECHAP